MKIARLFLLSVICLLTFCPAGAQSWRDSLAMLSRQIEQQPHSTDLRLRKAAVNIELGQWEYAVDEYGRVLELDPQNLAARYFRAYAYNHLRRYELAALDYEQFLLRSPLHFEARLGLAITKRNMGKRMEAMDELNRLVEQFPDSAVAFAARADYEQQQRQYELALYDWGEALRLSPGRAEYLLGQHATLWALRRYDEARQVAQELRRRGIAVEGQREK